MLNIFICFIALSVVTFSHRVSWNFGLRVGSGYSYHIPSGYSESDYSSYGAVGQLGSEVIHTFERLKEIRERLKQNESSDNIVKIIGGVSLIVFTLRAIIMHIKAMKDAVKVTKRGQQRNAVVMRHNTMTGF